MTYQKGIIFLTGNDKKINILKRLIDEGEIIKSLIFPFKAKDEQKINNLIEFANTYNIPFFRPSRNVLASIIEQIGACEFLITAGYPYVISKKDLSICKHNINIHPTLLPKYRGPNIEWYVIANGERETGVSIHFLAEYADKGAIIVQQKIELSKFDTIYSLLRKTSDIEPELLVKSLKIIREGYVGQIQDESNATFYPKIRTSMDSEIDPNKTITELYNILRACDPERFPAFFYIDGQKVAIKLFRPDKPTSEFDYI
jgi:methionyl-tRNA formyltransferase